MELISLHVIWSIIAIILIDIILAGDNALVIGMVANKFNSKMKKQVIVWGTIGAIAIRLISVFLLTQLLMIPGLRFIGGIVLVYIGWRLAFMNINHSVDAKDTFWGAIGTIVIADAVMGIDNALAIAAAANGNFLLVIFGLLISIPIILFGSTIVSKILTKYPDTVFIGSYVLFVVAIQMITKEYFVDKYIDQMHDWSETILPWIVSSIIVAKQYYRARIRVTKK